MPTIFSPRSLLGALAFSAAACIASTDARAESFTLTDKQGRSIKADVISVTAGQVKIRRDDGQTFDLPLSTLADTDQKNSRTGPPKKPPNPSHFPPARSLSNSAGVFSARKNGIAT